MTFAVLTPSAGLLRWMEDRIAEGHGHAPHDPANTICTVWFDEGQPVIVTAFDEFTEHSCFGTIVTDGTRPGPRQYIKATYEFLFTVRNINRLATFAAVENTAAVQLNKRLGHQQEGLHRDFFGPGKDAYSFSFLKSDWKKSRWCARSINNEQVQGGSE